MQNRTDSYRRPIIILVLIILEVLLIAILLRKETPPVATDWLTAYITESDEFRAMEFGEGLLANAETVSSHLDTDMASVVAAWFSGKMEHSLEKSDSQIKQEDFTVTINEKYCRDIILRYEQEKLIEWTKLVNGYRTVMADLRYFPVAVDERGLGGLSYENGWGDPRTYGGDRVHEGTDICDNENVRGSYPIVSMTDGVIEHIGWLEQGGYRIGIRAPHGAYFYYAHLASYAKEFTVGERVNAGQILGMMGDTGYSKVEGTTGNFVVHLHLGIYTQTDHYAELSVNPYYFLKYLENSTVSYTKESHLWYTE